jgi:hypothetical protein
MKYDDIINLPHPNSAKHPRMSLYDRAAQFSPFAALTGHEEAIEETARLTDTRTDLDEDMLAGLDEKIRIIRENLDSDLEVTVSYFVPDERKNGGSYRDYTGIVKKIDEYEQAIIMSDRTVIPISRIRGIDFRPKLECGI